MKGKLIFLGSGSSGGVPEIACHCSVCESTFIKNKRLRPSCLIKVNKKILLLDVSPDFRCQALKHHIDHIDGLLLTHTHYDHIGGLDELRKFNILENKPIPCLLSEFSLNDLKRSFYYIFEPQSIDSSLSTQLSTSVLNKSRSIVNFQGINIGYVSYFQKKTEVTGFRVGKLAYISDIKEYSEDIFTFLEGIDILILSAIRQEPSPVHFKLDDAIAFAGKVKAKKTYFTHIAHEIDHEKVSSILPENINLAYDGLELEFDYD